MNKRDLAIMEWIKMNRPDLASHIENIIYNCETNNQYQAMYLLLCTAFEGGRLFQSQNPELELDNPIVYLA